HGGLYLRPADVEPRGGADGNDRLRAGPHRGAGAGLGRARRRLRLFHRRGEGAQSGGGAGADRPGRVMTARIAGSCHCGAQRFTAPAPESVTECNCSTCTKRGTLAAYYAPGEVEFDLTPDRLAAYQWGDRMMTFHHCTV